MTGKKIKVLIVEDEELLLQAIEKKLQVSGMEPLCFSTAEDALEYLKVSGVTPDIFWVDHHLRGMTGLDFIKTLKAQPNLENIPVIVISNSASTQTVQETMSVGTTEYLLKAKYRLEDIVNVIQKYVKMNKEGLL